MIVKRGDGDFPKVYRPYSPYELCGQDEVKRLLIYGLKNRSLSQTYVFHGPSGTGKTTCARIIGMGMMCQNGPSLVGCGQCRECQAIMRLNCYDYTEINSANLTGVDHIRELRNQFCHGPLMAAYKVFVFDECHKLTEAAQNMLLKEVEDVYDGLYFVFCSTEPKRIIETLRNRCINIEFKSVDDAQIKTMLLEVCDWEGIPADSIDLEGIVQLAAGRPRNALFELQKAVATGNVPTNGGGKMFAIRNRVGGGRAMVVSLWPSFDPKAFGDALNNPAFLTGGNLLAEKTYPFEELVMPATLALRPDGENLKYRGTFSSWPDWLVETIKANKARIMALLKNDAPAPDPSPPRGHKPKLNRVQDWSQETINCCNGCTNGCLYCYARGEAVLRFGRLTDEQWKLGAVREKDVERSYPRYDKTVMFPSTHDITWDNFEACHTVLCKLVKAGNRILVVSKPRPELIGILCDDFEQYKDQIAFRFTIGASSDEILSFWEPGAPNLADRKESLSIAFARGFRTSVSMEPMLDSENVSSLVEELRPFVNWRIWIGTMNHDWYVKKYQDPAIEAALTTIQAGQTPDRFRVIHEQYRDDPMIRFKSDFLKKLDLPPYETSEQWPD